VYSILQRCLGPVAALLCAKATASRGCADDVEVQHGQHSFGSALASLCIQHAQRMSSVTPRAEARGSCCTPTWIGCYHLLCGLVDAYHLHVHLDTS
jgi:hypothetical protein